MSDQRQLALLDEVAGAIEALLLGGTTTASAATQRTLSAAFEEASRARFLRLGSTLRIVIEELKRLDSAPERFSGSRLAFFLDRAWLLASATRKALSDQDASALQRITALPANEPVAALAVATLGVHKRVVPGAFAAFEFRLRLTRPLTLAGGATLARGTPLLWSMVFPLRADLAVPPEAFLSLQQKQGFRPTDFLDRREILITQVQLSSAPPYRMTLLPETRVTQGEAVSDWTSLAHWDLPGWLAQLRAHRPDPLELAVELGSEALLPDWRIDGEFAPSAVPGREASEREAEISALGCRFRLRIDAGESALEQRLVAASGQCALMANVHVEYGRQVLMPLALIDSAPEYPTLDPKKFDKAALVRALNTR